MPNSNTITRLAIVGVCLSASPVAAQFDRSADGQAYLPTHRALLHTATKTAASTTVYASLRALHLKPAPAALLATVGVWSLAKAVEVAKGHRLGPLDTAHDLLAHSLIVVPLATKRRGPTIAVGLLWLGSCRASSPRWC